MPETNESTCRHCQRRVILIHGRWIDPEATGDDAVWRETCDAHDTFTAEHEPAVCERHGGTWGDDETCARCTYENGTVRSLDDAGPMGPGEVVEHDYAEYASPEILRDHLVEHHLVTPGTARTMHEAGGHHLRTMHRMMHREDPTAD